MVYLKSVKNFFGDDESFNWNYGIACCATGDFKEAEEALTTITDEKFL